METSNSIHKIDALESEYLYSDQSQIPDAGQGLFTVINIYKDEVIAIFKGDILTDKQAADRAKEGSDQYFVSLLDGSIMDSKHVECFAKYANDAEGFIKLKFKNNAKITLDEDGDVCIMAKRNINAGEEIFCGYGKRYWKKHSK